MKRLLAIALLPACASPAAQTPADDAHGIGYASVAEAFNAAKAMPQTSVSTEGDWMVFTHTADGRTTTWRFTRPGHPAHPSVILRRADEAAGTFDVRSLCEAKQAGACAGLGR